MKLTRQNTVRLTGVLLAVMAVAALAAGVPVSIEGAECVEKSWPEFWQVLQASLGAEVTLL